MTDRQMVMVLSVVIGLSVGLAAVTVKNFVFLIETNLRVLLVGRSFSGT